MLRFADVTGLRALPLLVALASACGSFRAAPLDTGDAAPPLDATPPDGRAPDAGPRECTPPACLFRDDFDGRGDVKGPWDVLVGAPALENSLRGGKHLRVDGAAGSSPAPAFLRKSLQGAVGGVEIEVGIATAMLVTDFGRTIGDYCELVAIELGEITLAMLYAHDEGVSAWIWGDTGQTTGSSGRATVNALDGQPFPKGRLAVRWAGDRATMTGELGGAVIGPSQVGFTPGRASLPVSVRVGLACRGKVAGVRLSIDDVVVRAL